MLAWTIGVVATAVACAACSTGGPGTGGSTAATGATIPTAPAPTTAGRIPAPEVAGAPATLLPPDTLLAWTPRRLPDGFAAAVAALPGVDRVVEVVGGTAWMTASSDADGSIVDRPPHGFAIPLDLAAADPAAWEPFLPPADGRYLSALRHGDALLGSASADLRRLGSGGELSLGDRTLRRAGVVPDADVGAAEIFVSRATAASLGITTPRYLLVDPAPDASRDGLARAIQAAAPAGVPLRVRGRDQTPFLRNGDAVLAPVVMKRAMGEFDARPLPDGRLEMDPRWVDANIETADVPILGTVSCNRALMPPLRGALAELVERGLSHLIDPAQYRGCYNPRFVGRDPGATLSHHAWGAAVDVNVGANPFGSPPHQDPRLVDAFERWGFTWGGEWLVPDGMHFEYYRPAVSG